MTTETEQQPTWGEEPPPRAAAAGTGWSGRKTLAAVAIAVGIAAVGGGVIYAASNSDAARGMGGPGGYGRGPGGGLVMMGGPFGDTQHGEFQNGEVTEVGDASITVKSGDGFSETYSVDGDTRVNGGQGDLDDIERGDVVTVIATEAADGEATADSIMKGDVMRGGPRQGNGQPPVKQDRQGGPTDQQGTPPTR
ncbi:hypothetical protein IOD16_08465 [Saccharothrix sp. 6-C]|uniref:hypothetical protein n=1 Tax=Saccharothrix sp. 6-C TaxID=2781735 RepID=UPI001917592B|nr:hypothetical protein [Saccharothrix sp. 6-C]QQQ78476.1 hypothetical protein IOD16_08465 [Saccharothrix sp. 6-C]